MFTVLGNLVVNTLIVFGFMFIFSLYYPILQTRREETRHVLIGLSFGLFGIVNMLLTVELITGVVVDVRAPFVIAGGIAGGLPGALIAGTMIAVWRGFVMGGLGATGGSLGMLATIPLGWAAYMRKSRYPRLSAIAAAVAALFVGIFAGYLTLPYDVFLVFLENFLPTNGLLYPVVTLLLAELLSRQERIYETRTALQLSEARFRAVFDQARHFIGLCSLDGTLLDVNASVLAFGRQTKEAVVGQRMWEADWWGQSSEIAARGEEAIHKAAAGETSVYRIEMEAPDGEVRTVAFSVAPIRDSQGNVVLLLAEGRDISAEVLAEKQRVQLAIQQREVEVVRTFIEDASHHLRTPITILQTSTYLLRRYFENLLASPSQMNEEMTDQTRAAQARLGKMDASLGDLTRIVESLLELTRLDDRIAHEREKLDAVADLRDIIQQFLPLATQQNIDLQLRAGTTSIELWVGPQNYHLVLQNLIENAIRYTDAGGRVVVSLREDEDSVVFRVEDNGIGIPPEDQEKVFSRFYRSANAQARKHKGTGLGLAIVRRIVEQEGGSISLESTPGEGTTVTVRFPGGQAAEA